MAEWISSFSVLGAVYFWIAVVFSVLLILQIVLMLFSFGGDAEIDADMGGMDADGADGAEVGTGISIFTVKGITCFFTLGAWVGLLFVSILPKELEYVSLAPAFICGLAAMFGFAFLMKAMLRLQSSGNLLKENLIGKEATVYVSIQPKRTGRGKITLTAQGQYRELDAITDENKKLSVDEKVIICDVVNGTAIVRKVD